MVTDHHPRTSPARSPKPSGDLDVPARAAGPVSVRLSRWWQESAWAPLAVKATGVLAGMLALAAVGAASLPGTAGIPVVSAAPKSSGSAWLPPEAAPDRASQGRARDGTDPAATRSAVDPTTPKDREPPLRSLGTTPDGKIILNAATAEDLQKLPRVGPKRAQAILELRAKLGRFRQPTDLLRVRGIGRKTLRQLLPLLVVEAPPQLTR